MITLYVIRSEQNGDFYVGITKDMARRLLEHAQGGNRCTKGLRPWVLKHTEAFPDWTAARKQEKYYKTGRGKEALKLMLTRKAENL